MAAYYYKFVTLALWLLAYCAYSGLHMIVISAVADSLVVIVSCY